MQMEPNKPNTDNLMQISILLVVIQILHMKEQTVLLK